MAGDGELRRIIKDLQSKCAGMPHAPCHGHPQTTPQPPLSVPLAPAAPPLHPSASSSFALGQKSPSWKQGGRGAGQTARAVPAHPCCPAETIAELNRSYREQNLPVTDGSRELHSLCAQLEFLLQVLPPLGGAGSRGSSCQAFWGTLGDVICLWASPAIQVGGHEDWPRLHPYVEHLLWCVQQEGKLRHKASKWSCPQPCGVRLGKPAEYHRDRLGSTGTLLVSPCLFQFDLKEKKSFFGQRKDYWDFLCQGLAQRRQEHEGIRFVTSLDKVGMGQWRGLTGHPLGGHGHRRWMHSAWTVLGVQVGMAVLHHPCFPPAEDPCGQRPCLPALLPGAPAASRVPATLPARPREPQVRAWGAQGWLCHCKAWLPALCA